MIFKPVFLIISFFLRILVGLGNFHEKRHVTIEKGKETSIIVVRLKIEDLLGGGKEASKS